MRSGQTDVLRTRSEARGHATTSEPGRTFTSHPRIRTVPTTAAAPALTDDMLARFADRAAIYDRENRFAQEDFDELKQSGYLDLALPPEFGGPGLPLSEIAHLQRRLAYHAAPTALAVNMHFYWTGVFADLWRAGDRSVEPFLRDAASGEVFAAGHAEGGNDIPVLLSTTRAEKVAGGYRFHGKKSFGSLGPAWTRLGLHGLDTSDPAAPKVVHAFMPRGAQGSSTVPAWDVLGMRATQSDDTILDGVFVPDSGIARIVPAGAAGVDAFVLGIYAWALLGFGNVYCGLAQRAFDTVVASVKTKRSMALTRPMAYHPEVQHAIAEMRLELEGIAPHLDAVATDWSNGVDHGMGWVIKIVSAKHRAVQSAWQVVDKGLDLLGGFGIFKSAGYERLWRDARLGRLHPANPALTHELLGKLSLGINPDETPRWG
jgi:alkylation response protein AidB-like acyl-CoA dehydrogenase